MSRYSKLMSRHKTKLNVEKLYRGIETLCRDTMKRKKKEILSGLSFLCRDNHKSNSAKLYCDIFKVYRNTIQEKST